MIPIKEALAAIREHEPPVRNERVLLADSLDRILTGMITAPEPLPRFTNSAMDGFAVLWSDVESVGDGAPCTLAVSGESRAGSPYGERLQPGSTVRISTGAMLPDGADTVIPVEDIENTGDLITIQTAGVKHQHVRYEGEEIAAGDVILENGSRLTPASIGILASLGIEQVDVSIPPTIGIVVSGHELAEPDTEVLPWQIRDSNAIMLAAAVTKAGGIVTSTGRCGDLLEETEAAISTAAESAQIVIVSGGVSVGPHDLVKEAAGRAGFAQVFWRVNQKPGKPLFFATRDDRLLFGLPGNPVSALNCFAYFVHPLLQRMQGIEFIFETLPGVIRSPFKNRADRTLFLRVAVRSDGASPVSVTPLGKQGSHMLSSMTEADGFLLLDPGVKLNAGDDVSVHLYPWRT
ncbi:gephyrin-like molybdotransferase Glp [Candidatus Zixiibacteriota bacterium]